MVYYLNCLVQEEPYRDPISVRIGERDTIGELKKSIKAERSDLARFSASELKLWLIELKSRIKEKWTPCFSNITLSEFDLIVINELPDQLIKYVPEIEMQPLYTISKYFNANSYTYDPLCIHIMAGSTYLKELCCETKYEDKEFNEERMLEESVLDHYFWIDKFKVNTFIIIKVDQD
ncbi:hypothetical protein C1646_765248 [Rhizophagus diaphanus]|nr:hypothetical protein C1646_765248 [Rhizophagus diaphanus] [Rhizophagus sp. MUCL 43196]